MTARWDKLTLRTSDIIVCTPAKCGTTWTQMICALLVHQSATLPQPLTRLSRWLDRLAQPIGEVVADFEAQPFRRVIKTHTPLDGLPFDARVSYVVCGGDSRDAFLSMVDHVSNLSDETVNEIVARLGAAGDSLPFPNDPNVLFPFWMTTPEMPWMEDGFPWGSIFYYMRSFWKFRQLNNIAFLHYDDLSDNLDAEMRRLSDCTTWPFPRQINLTFGRRSCQLRQYPAFGGRGSKRRDHSGIRLFGPWLSAVPPIRQN